MTKPTPTRRGHFLLLLLFTLPVAASEKVTYEQVTVAGTSIGITSTITNPLGSPQQDTCNLRLETAQIRYRMDGIAPTSSVGMPLDVGDVLEIKTNEDAQRFRAIRTGATSGLLNVECYR